MRAPIDSDRPEHGAEESCAPPSPAGQLAILPPWAVDAFEHTALSTKQAVLGQPRKDKQEDLQIPSGAKASCFGKFLEAQRLRVLTLLGPVCSDASFSSKFIIGNLSF